MISIPNLLLSLLAAEGTAGQPEGTPGDDLDIVSESDCPSSQAVREALTRLRPPADWPDASVVIRATQDSLSIELGERSPIVRELALGQNCADRASSAALVIATWMDDLPAQAARAPVLSAEAAAPPPSLPDVAGYEVGAGLSAGASGGWAPGLHAEVVRRKPGHLLGWQAHLDILGPHTVDVSQGSTRWMRTSLGVGLHGRLAFQRIFFAADAGLAGGCTTAWGTGYTNNATDSSFIWGPVGGLRAGFPWGRFRIWADWRTRWWVKGDSVQIDSPSPAWVESADLPSWEWQASLGLSYLMSAR